MACPRILRGQTGLKKGMVLDMHHCCQDPSSSLLDQPLLAFFLPSSADDPPQTTLHCYFISSIIASKCQSHVRGHQCASNAWECTSISAGIAKLFQWGDIVGGMSPFKMLYFSKLWSCCMQKSAVDFLRRIPAGMTEIIILKNVCASCICTV